MNSIGFVSYTSGSKQFLLIDSYQQYKKHEAKDLLELCHPNAEQLSFNEQLSGVLLIKTFAIHLWRQDPFQLRGYQQNTPGASYSHHTTCRHEKVHPNQQLKANKMIQPYFVIIYALVSTVSSRTHPGLGIKLKRKKEEKSLE